MRQSSSFDLFIHSQCSVADTFNCKWYCAYANELPVLVEDLDVDKLRTFAVLAVGLMGGQHCGWKAFWDSKTEW